MNVSLAMKDSSKMLDSSSSSLGKSLAKSKSRKSSSLPSETVEYLKQWIMSPEHIAHPYPTEQEKAQIMEDTGIEMKQLTNWFVNNRKRFWKPRVEAKIRKPSLKSIVMPQKASREQSDASFNDNQNISLVDMVTQMHEREVGRSQTPRRISSSGLPDQSTSLVSPWSVISMQSITSEENSITSSESVGDLSGSGQETEEPITTERASICVHILRPVSSDLPTLEDVTTLTDIPSESILRTFRNCELILNKTLDESATNNEVEIQKEEEIARIKAQCLQLYLDDLSSRKRKVVDYSEKAVEHTVPRPKFRRVSFELWKDACRSAENVYDKELPSLEEAVTLFGYAVVKP